MNDVRKACYAKWRKLIDEQQSSGLSRAKFCNQNNIVLSQFTYYYSVIKSRLDTHVGPAKADGFTPVTLSKGMPNLSEEIRVLLPNGFQYVFPANIAVGRIKALMEALSC